MSDTRNALRSLGEQATRPSEQELINAGAKTLRDEIRRVLSARGISEAVGFEVQLKNGEQFTILSDDNPRMNTPAFEVQQVTVKQSARAGAGEVSNIRLTF